MAIPTIEIHNVYIYTLYIIYNDRNRRNKI